MSAAQASPLAGRGVVLTGASGGIGSALCAALRAAGAHVYAVGRDPARLLALAAQAAPGGFTPVVADLAAADGPARVRDALSAAARGPGEPAPSVLVLGAAVSHFGLFADASESALREQVETNLLAPMRLAHALLPMLAAAAGPGAPAPAVVAIGSTFGSLGYPGFGAYSASKFGLRGFIEAMGREHADGPVRWQYLAPRATRTAFNSPAVDALNAALGTAVDAPSDVAAQLVADIARGTRRRQLGWPERLFARLNGLLPELVDRALAGQLPTIRAHATSRVSIVHPSAAGPAPAAVPPPAR